MSVESIPRSPGDPRAWFDEAVRLDEENRELRRLMTTVILWAAERAEILAFGRDLIDRRWPPEEAKAA